MGSAKASRMNSCGIFGSATFSILTIQIPPGERGEALGGWILCWANKVGRGDEADRLAS